MKGRKKSESKISKVVKTSNERIMASSNCVVFVSKNSRFIKQQEVNGLFSSFGIKAPESQIPLIGPILF